jgi:WD40 repeat protein
MKNLIPLSIILITLTGCNEPENKPPPTSEQTETITFRAPPKPKLPTAPPILQIDTGGHKSLITDVTFTADGRYLVSAGEDKVVRVWDIETGETVRTLRGEIGAGDEGKIYAMALSPDERWLAVGGWMLNDEIRLYNFPTGELVTLLKGHSNVVLSLAFSPNSRYLVSGQGGSYNQIAIIWDINQQQQLHTLKGHTDRIYSSAFTPDSKRAVTGSLDHSLRLWRVSNGELIAKLEGHTDKVYSVAISPQDGTIASGSLDNTIRLWNGETGQFIKTLANQGTVVGSLSFSPDGSYLVSGTSGSGKKHCHVWSYPSGKEIVTYKEHDNIVLATAISPDGRWVATGGGNNHEFHIWNLRDGTIKQRLRGVGASIWAVGFSEDDKHIGWGKTGIQQYNQAGKLEYRLRLPSSDRPLGTPKQIKTDQNYLRAKDKWQDWSLSRRKGGDYGYYAILDIKNQNSTVASIERGSTDGYGHSSYTFTPNGQTIISGGANGHITAYQRDGSKIGDYIGHTGDVWAVAVSADGRFLLSGSADQTVRLWNVETRENLLTLFHGSNEEWVAWTNSGHYTASANGDKMVGWQLNKGVDSAADYVTATQLRKHFFRPDIIAQSILLASAKQAVAQAGGSRFSIDELMTAQLPKFEIVEPQKNSLTHNKQLQLVLDITGNDNPIKTIEVYVNDSLAITRGKIVLPQRRESYRKTIDISLEQGMNKLRIIAKNRIGETAKDWQIKYLSRQRQQQGNLYLIAIGVSDYQQPGFDLKYAAADARAVYHALVAQQGKTYKQVKSVLLADGAQTPTAANIQDSLDILYQATANDTVIIFLAGHGVNEDNNYYFLPQEAKQGYNQRWRKSSVIKWRVLQDALEETAGRRILLVDTCHSGGAFNSRLIKDAADARITVISATDSETVAQELPQLKHGVFTYALLEGLKGKADYNRDKLIKIKELDTYIAEKVEQLTGGTQMSVSYSASGLKNFVLAQ